jgi:addiction module RelB/DinJ family antitoxin
MTEQVRYRIDKSLMREFAAVCESLGVSPSQAMSMFAAQMVKLRGFPFRPSDYPALEEYGVTLDQAERAFAKADKELDADEKAVRLVEFKGKLP